MAWDESEHPRDSDGKFSDGNGSTLSKAEWRLYYNKLSSLKVKRGAEYMNIGGIPTIRIDDKLIMSSGTFEKPKVDVIIPITGKDKWHK